MIEGAAIGKEPILGSIVQIKHTLIFPDGTRCEAGRNVPLIGTTQTSHGQRWTVHCDGHWCYGLQADDFEVIHQ